MINHTNDKRSILLLLSLLVISLLHIIIAYSEISIDLYFLKLESVIIFIWGYFLAYTRLDHNMLHPYMLFLSTLFLFIYNRLFLDVLGFVNISVPSFMTNDILNEKNTRTSIHVLIVFASSLTAGFLLSRKYNEKNILSFDRNYYKIGVFLFFLGFIPALFIQYQIMTLAINLGYLAIFRGELIYEPNILIKFLASFFRIGYFLILISIPKKSVFTVYTILFSVFILMNLFTGTTVISTNSRLPLS